MKVKIIQIGNSQGIRIPKKMLEESGIVDEADLEICTEGILLRNVQKPRSNWETLFAAGDEDEETIDMNVNSTFDSKQWQW